MCSTFERQGRTSRPPSTVLDSLMLAAGCSVLLYGQKAHWKLWRTKQTRNVVSYVSAYLRR